MTHGGTFPGPPTYPSPGVPDTPNAPAAVLLDQVARFFGGPPHPTELDYRTPTVTGLGSVRRGFSNPGDPTYYFTTMPTGTTSLLVVSLLRTTRVRQTMGIGTGRKVCRHDIELGLYTRSTRQNPTLAFDDVLTLTEAVVDRIEADPDCGTGGWEHEGLSLGEGSGAGLTVSYPPPPSAAQRTAYTLQRAVISAVATQYVTA